MNYYKRHLGDYAKKAGHLSPLEHGVYTLILDSYYDREQGPTLMEATRWARARTEEEKSAVLAVLDEFFTLGTNERYTQNRVEEELSTYRAQAEVNRGIALEREKRKRERRDNESSTKRAPSVPESSEDREPSHKPEAISHKPIEEIQSAGAQGDLVGNQVLGDDSGDKAPKQSAQDLQVGEVFEHWKQVMDSPRSILDDKRKKLIRAALKMGYTAEQLRQAIDGCRKSPYHMGDNEGRTKYNSIDLIFRSADKIDKFIVIGTSTLAPVPRQNGRPSINSMTDLGADDPFNNFRRAG